MTWIGALIAFTAAVATAVALVLQALEARSSPPSEGASVRLLLDLARRPRWLFGTSLVIIAWSLQIVALGFAPITLVQPILATFQLVLLVLARVWLKERINLCEYGGVAAIIVGILLLIMAAPQRSVLHPSASRLAPPLVLLAGAILFALVLARRRQRSGRSSGLQVTIGAGLGYAWADLVDKLVSNNATSHHFVIAALWLLTVMIMGGSPSRSSRRRCNGALPVRSDRSSRLCRCPCLSFLRSGAAWRPGRAVSCALSDWWQG